MKRIKISIQDWNSLKALKSSASSQILDRYVSKKRKLTKEKLVEKRDNFEVVSPKTASEILKKLIEEYFKYFEGSEKESEGLVSTDGITDTKSILESIEYILSCFGPKSVFKETYQKYFQFWSLESLIK